LIRITSQKNEYNTRNVGFDMSTSVKVKINPEVLVWARKTANYNIEKISKKMDLDSDRINDWENGKETPTYIQLLDLANYYRRPAMLFFSPKIPETDPDSVPDFRTVPGRKKGDYSTQILFELRSARARRYNLTLVSALGEYEIPKFNLKAQINDNIQALAEKTKEELGVSWGRQDSLKNYNQALEFWISKVEDIGVLVFQFYDIEPKEMRGYAIYYDKLPIIGINVREHPHGKLFTLFHELGHLALNKEGVSNFSSYELKDDVEIFCNNFAAEILVPKNQLLEMGSVKRIADGTIDSLTLFRLSKRFNVSSEVIIRRLLSLKKVSWEFLQEKKEKWNSYIAPKYRSKKEDQNEEKEEVKLKKSGKKKNKDKTKKDPNVSRALKRNGLYYTGMILEAYNDDLINASDLSEFLGEKLHTITEMESRVFKRGVEE